MAFFFFYILIYLRAKRHIKLAYQLRDFKEFAKMKNYLLYAYLKKNGFATHSELEELIQFIQSENKLAGARHGGGFTSMIFKVFVAAFLAIYSGSFLIQVEDGWSRFLAMLFILVTAIVLFYVGHGVELVLRHFFRKTDREAANLIRSIIYIETVLRVNTNTDYHPFRMVEKKSRRNTVFARNYFFKILFVTEACDLLKKEGALRWKTNEEKRWKRCATEN
ncbi:hypothetical protein [Listeria floridensis]|uniref:hypothetical protein n=1 Tax=Listeria floridensis TaxID=1494962 RepID=UPI0004AFE20C|nr:hypothetical protein [Listeria floridensis]